MNFKFEISIFGLDRLAFFHEFGTRLIVVLSFSIEYDMTIHLRSEVKDKKILEV